MLLVCVNASYLDQVRQSIHCTLVSDPTLIGMRTYTKVWCSCSVSAREQLALPYRLRIRQEKVDLAMR
jgi:hypothetical protein